MSDSKGHEPRSLTVDELLEKESAEPQPILVTIEPVQDVPDSVAVRPYTGGARCLCHLIIEIPKNTIRSVTPTGLHTQCCGKRRSVVDIHFKTDSTMLLTDLFGQLSSAAASLD